MSLDIQPVLIFADGSPVSSLNPLPTTGGGGGGGTVDQGAANGDATKGWSARLTDGAAFIVPAKTGQLPAALGATTAAGSVSVGIATDQLSTLASATKQDTGNTSLSSIDSKVATAANQTTGNATLTSILGQLDSKTSTLATASAQSTGNTSLATIATQQTDGTQKTQVTSSVLPTGAATAALQGAGLPAALVGGKLDVNLGTSSITLPVSGPLTDAQLRATPVPVSGTVTVTSTTANQGTGAGAAAPWSVQLSDGAASYTGAKTGQLPSTLGQTTAAGSLSVVLNSNQVGTAGSSASTVLSVQGIASGTNLPVSQATASALNATVVGSGSAGTAATGVVTVQGIASMTPVQVSQATAANLNATVAQGAGSGATGTFWYTRVTDGTNTMPTMDTAARSGFQRITDGTNTAAVKAASTAVVASDPAVAVSLSPNSALPTGDNTIGRTKITDGTSVAAIASGTASAVNAQVVTPNQQQTFVVSAQGIAPGNGKSMISLANGSGSGKTIRIQAISFYPVTDSAVAGVNVQFDGFKFTTHASGTSLTPIALDSANSLSGSVTAQTNATITGSGTIALDSWFQNSDEITSASLTPSAQASIDGQRRRVYGGCEMQPIVVRAGEGFYIKCQTNTTVGAFSVFMWFTQE